MRVISANLNGIRAAARKGFFEWFLKQDADVLCIQETKAQRDQLDDPTFHPEGYHNYFFDAVKKGYSGVAIYSRHKPLKVSTGLGWHHADTEGRWIQVDFEKLSVASLYLPSGSASDERHNNKLLFMGQLLSDINQMKQDQREWIICGDWNMIHKEIDIKNFKGNQKNSGCTPQEQQWMDELFTTEGWVDAFREVNKQAEQYTWWSNRGQAWANNTGWRIDYQVISDGLKDKVIGSSIYREERFSDHAPLTIDYDYKL